MTTETVCVPRELLRKIYRDLDSCQRVIHYAGGFDPAYVTDAQDCLKEMDALLAQQVEIEPVAFVGGDEVQRFMTWAPDKPAFIHPIGTPLYVSPPAMAIQDLIALDRQYIAGFSAGWNAGVTGDEDTKRLAINGRLAEIHAVLAAPQPTEGSTDE